MLRLICFFIVTGYCSINAQYQFKGTLSTDQANKAVYLSLVENYRKSSRIYVDQIIQKTLTDSTGNFTFTGNHLTDKNRVYRIHIDECDNEDVTRAHFLKECGNSQQILFIANNIDTISFPILANNQPLCEIVSTNEKSGLLLEIEARKEQMALDFMEQGSNAHQQLTLKKWFENLQDHSQQSNEPLAELYVYDFISDRENETHAHYMTDLKTNPYYDQLSERLENEYPNSSFATQYQNELLADRVIQNENVTKSAIPIWKYLLYGGILFLFFQVAYFNFKRNQRDKKKNPFDSLTSQERTIMGKIAEGKSNKEIASELFISLSTVKTHINNLYKKLKVTSREEIKALLN